MKNNEIFAKEGMQKVLNAEKTSAEIMMNSLVRDLKPTSLIDIGCGPGHFANEVKRLDETIDVSAVDIEESAKDFINPNVNFNITDLSVPMLVEKKSDVVICLEVVEHIDEKHEYILCENIVKHVGKYLVVTIAQPHQKDPGHINLKEPIYWINKFEKLGLTVNIEMTKKWINEWLNTGKVERYFVQNLLVLEK